MPRSAREHDKVAGAERDLAGLTLDLKPAATRGNDVKRRVAVRLDAEPPRSSHQRPAVHRAADPYGPQNLCDRVRGGEVAQPFHRVTGAGSSRLFAGDAIALTSVEDSARDDTFPGWVGRVVGHDRGIPDIDSGLCAIVTRSARPYGQPH